MPEGAKLSMGSRVWNSCVRAPMPSSCGRGGIAAMSLTFEKRGKTRVGAIAACLVALIGFGVCLPSAARDTAPSVLDQRDLKRTLSASPLTEEQRILHVLNRLGYGPRPGDVEKVRAMGLGEYIARQLE